MRDGINQLRREAGVLGVPSGLPVGLLREPSALSHNKRELREISDTATHLFNAQLVIMQKRTKPAR